MNSLHTGQENVTEAKILPFLIVVFVASMFFSIAVNSIALGLIGVVWVLMMVKEKRFTVRPTPLDYYFLAYVCVELIASIFSYNQAQSFLFSKRLLLLSIVYLFASLVTTERMARLYVGVLLGSAVVVSLIGMVKLIFGDPQENIRLGIFQFYMTTSELMMIAALLLFPFVIHPKTPRTIRITALLGLIPVLIALYATVTRGAYLAAAAGLLFVSVVSNKRLILPIALVLLMVLLFAPPYVQSRLQSIVDIHHGDNESRLLLWKTGWKMFLDHPITGIGDIDMHELYLQYMEPDDPAQHGHFHNIAMQILVTLGLPGFLVVMAMFFKIFQTEWRIFSRVKGEWFAGSFVLGAMAVFIGFHVSGLTEWTFGDQEVVILFWTSLGLTLAMGSIARSRTES